MAGLPPDIGDDQREQQAGGRRSEPVEQLDRNDQIGISDTGEQDAADRQELKPRRRTGCRPHASAAGPAEGDSSAVMSAGQGGNGWTFRGH